MTNNPTRKSSFVAQLLLFAAVSAMAGCAHLGSAYREQAESAFRRQNQLSGDFMLVADALESQAPIIFEGLLDQEATMLAACRPLNTLATKRRNNQSTDFEEKRAALKSVSACRKASSGFDEALQQAQRNLDRATGN